MEGGTNQTDGFDSVGFVHVHGSDLVIFLTVTSHNSSSIGSLGEKGGRERRKG